MARAGHNDRGRSGPEAVPPFWLRADEEGVGSINHRVLGVAKDNWPWAFRLIKKQLNDGARTPDIVEDVAVEVSNRLSADAEVGRNLSGYFRTAVIRRVKTLAARDSRITYEGGAQDLEVNHRPTAPDWTKIFEDRMALQSLVPYMSHPVRLILHYRLLDYSWKYISERLTLTEKQAKSRFYYGVRQAHDELLAVQKHRLRGEESEQWK
jgi:DNA-directed RNA polymerase specialized sigma24 family protein